MPLLPAFKFVSISKGDLAVFILPSLIPFFTFVSTAVFATIAPLRFARPIRSLPNSVLALPLGGILSSPDFVIPIFLCALTTAALVILPAL